MDLFDDEEYLTDIAKENGMILELVSDTLKRNKDFVLTCIEKHPLAI